MNSISHTLHAMVRHLELLGWHVKQLRDDSGVTMEIDGGIAVIKQELDELRDDLDAYDKRTVHDLGLIQDAINGEREYQEAMADAADARR